MLSCELDSENTQNHVTLTKKILKDSHVVKDKILPEEEKGVLIKDSKILSFPPLVI